MSAGHVNRQLRSARLTRVQLRRSTSAKPQLREETRTGRFTIMNKHRTASVVLWVAVLAAVGAPTARASVVDCAVYADYPNIKVSSARNMTCGQASNLMKSYRGNISRRFTVRAFTCTQQSGGQFGGQWRCAKGSRAFRFEFRD
jgi:hypothetical protein